ncbi:MAG: hypothetical protein P1P84_12200 [Deferrisomatales bacterium]|nr:hypothetical protein [Deferrisomatales bacterium]
MRYYLIAPQHVCMGKLLLVLLVMVGGAWGGHSKAVDRLADLDGFLVVEDAVALQRAITGGIERVLVPQGRYLVDNPLYIDRPGMLFLFGAGRLRTVLVARNPSQPMLVVRELERLSVAGVELAGSAVGTDAPLIATVNTRTLQLEIQDSLLRGGGLQLGGPGQAIVQGSHFNGFRGDRAGNSVTGIVLNNPKAELHVVAGNMSNHSGAHVTQLAGHLGIYGTGMQTHGAADIVLKAPSWKGAHVIAAVRSEGTNRQAPSVFLSVPKSAAPVDVVLKANNFTSPRLGSRSASPCALPVASDIFADYHAAGQLWLLGNFGNTNVGTLVRGSEPRMVVVALGNAVKGCVDPIVPSEAMFDVPSTARLIEVDNLFDYEAVSGDPETPRRRFVSPSSSLSKYQHVPPVPEPARDGVIPRLSRPTISRTPEAGFLRSVIDFVSTPSCRDALDDTCYLQEALDREGARLYFPPGDYHISRPLRLNQTGREVGGMIAGAGSDATRIECSGDQAFTTDGMAYVTIQGLTFAANGGGGAVVGLEWPEEVGGRKNPFVATQGNNFYDVRFEGGKYGLGIGRLSPRQCSENLVVNSTFSRSTVGLAVGHYNALANTVHGVRFQDTDWNLGFSDEGTGGTWAVFDAVAEGTKAGVIYRPSVGRNLYHNRFSSDGPQLLSMGWNSNESIFFFEYSDFTSDSPKDPFLDFNAGQGAMFLHSRIMNGNLRVSGNGAASFVLSIYSRLPSSVSVPKTSNCDGEKSEIVVRKSCFARFDTIGATEWEATDYH